MILWLRVSIQKKMNMDKTIFNDNTKKKRKSGAKNEVTKKENCYLVMWSFIF